jgi:hypothetical protein
MMFGGRMSSYLFVCMYDVEPERNWVMVEVVSGTIRREQDFSLAKYVMRSDI